MSERPTRTISESRDSLSEIVGDESAHGQRMQAGAILDLMDVLAGRISIRHSESMVATLSFDRVDLIYPILHQDLVRLDGQLVWVGNSSMTIEVRGYRKDLSAREFMPVQRSFITMVAIEEVGKANRNIPGLRYETPEEEKIRDDALRRRELNTQWHEVQEAKVGAGQLKAAEVEEDSNREKREFLSPAESEIEVSRVFLPRNLNRAGTIFGGDVLLWMDRLATYTARHFTRNRNMVTIAMNRIFFKQPIFSTDLVQMKARVVYVRNFTLEVEIAVTLERPGGERVPSHSGTFIVLNYDEAGFKRPIVTGLRLADDDQEGLRAYEKAKARHRFWRASETQGG